MARREAATSTVHPSVSLTEHTAVKTFKATEPRKTLTDLSNTEGKSRTRNVQDVERELQDEHRKNRKLQEEANKFVRDSEVLRHDNESLRTDINTLKTKLQDLVRQKGTLESRYSSLRGTAEDLSRRDFCVRRVEQTLEQRKKHTIDQLAEENCTLQTQLQESDKRIAELETTLKAMKDESSAINGMLEAAKDESTTLKSDLAQQRDLVASLAGDLERASHAFAEKAALEAKLEAESQLHSQAYEQVQQLTAACAQAQFDLEQAKAATETCVSSAVEQMRQQVEKLQFENASLLTSSVDASQCALQVQNKLEAELKASQARVLSERKSYEDLLAHACTRHESETRVIMAQLDEEACAVSAARAELVAVRSMHEDTIKDLTTNWRVDLQRTDAALADKSAQVIQLDANMVAAQNEIESITAALSFTNQQVVTLLAQLNDANAKLSEAWPKAQELTLVRAELETERSLHVQSRSEIAELKAKHEAQLRDVELTWERKFEQMRVERVESQQQREETAALEQALLLKEEERAKLQQAFNELTEQCAPFRGLIDQLASSEIQREKAFEEAEKLAAMNAQLAGHNNSKQKIKYVERMRDEISTLRKEVTMLRAQVQSQKPKAGKD